MNDIRRYRVSSRSQAYWYRSPEADGTSDRYHWTPLTTYYASNDLEMLVNTLASAFPAVPLFFWDKRDDLDWPGSDEFGHFGAPYRPGCVTGYYVDSPAVRGTLALLPGGDSLVSACEACTYRDAMMAGRCSLFNNVCESRGTSRWAQ